LEGFKKKRTVRVEHHGKFGAARNGDSSDTKHGRGRELGHTVLQTTSAALALHILTATHHFAVERDDHGVIATARRGFHLQFADAHRSVHVARVSEAQLTLLVASEHKQRIFLGDQDEVRRGRTGDDFLEALSGHIAAEAMH
jgi:hypothetical protein